MFVPSLCGFRIVGAISGPISTERNGIVAKILDKQEPSTEDIAKNFDQTRDQLLEQRLGGIAGGGGLQDLGQRIELALDQPHGLLIGDVEQSR